MNLGIDAPIMLNIYNKKYSINFILTFDSYIDMNQNSFAVR